MSFVVPMLQYEGKEKNKFERMEWTVIGEGQQDSEENVQQGTTRENMKGSRRWMETSVFVWVHSNTDVQCQCAEHKDKNK